MAKAQSEIVDDESDQSPNGEWRALDLLKKSAEASLVLAAFLFVTGWSYLYGYYKGFGIPLHEVAPSIQEAIVYSFRAVFNGWLSGVGFLAGGVGASLLLAIVLRYSRRLRALAWFFVLFTYFGMFFLASYSASSIGIGRAHQQIFSENAELPQVRIDVDRTKFSDVLVEAGTLAKGDYKMALYQAERVWIFKPVRNDSEMDTLYTIVMIPKEAIRGLTVNRATR